MPTIPKELKELFKDHDAGRLVLPDFQRDFIWKIEQQQLFLSSFFVALPVGGILLLNGNLEDFKARKLCFPNEDISIPTHTFECNFLLDGQQRISVLRSCLVDLFHTQQWREKWDALYDGLRYRWFLRVKPMAGETDVYGYNNLLFPEKENTSYPTKLEPDDIQPHILYRKINKTKFNSETDWFHPGFLFDNASDEQQKRNIIAQRAAQQGQIPLYELGAGLHRPLHKQVLALIADDRKVELQAECGGNINRLRNVLDSTTYATREEIRADNQIIIDKAFGELAQKWANDFCNYIEARLGHEIQTTIIPSEEVHRAVATFETMNEGGTPLSIFDLIVAKAARAPGTDSLSRHVIAQFISSMDLNEALWGSMIGLAPTEWSPAMMKTVNHNILAKKVQTQFLNILSILSHCGDDAESIAVDDTKKQKHLKLSNDQIHLNKDLALKALTRALAFLQFRCGIISIDDISYDLMILPVAYVLRKDENWESKSCIAKIEAWYWSVLFGGRYIRPLNELFIDDIKALNMWISDGGINPFKTWVEHVLDQPNYSDREILLRNNTDFTIPGAIHKSILQYVLSRQPKDFLLPGRLNSWDFALNETRPHDHHICPLMTAASLFQSAQDLRNKDNVLNSSLNRTYISEAANSRIRNLMPAIYLTEVSEIATWGHFVPNEFLTINQLSTEENYRNVLAKRYDRLREEIITEIDSLCNVHD